jgi:hypothetical protein
MELQSFRDPQEYYQITMPQNTPYWNLTETAAWVVFRNLSVVERFSGPSRDHWQAYMMYAKGRSGDPGSKMMTIPAIEWETLIVSPPSAYRLLPDKTKDTPWHDIRVSGANVQKLWRGTSETTSRAKFDWVIMPRANRRSSRSAQMKKLVHPDLGIVRGVPRPKGFVAANIPHISFHDIRRTISTGMEKLGVPHRVISLTAGHFSTGIEEHYRQAERRPYEEMLNAYLQWEKFVGA